MELDISIALGYINIDHVASLSEAPPLQTASTLISYLQFSAAQAAQAAIVHASQDKVALITGGGKNLGADTARQLAKEGTTLAIHYNSAKSKDETEAFVAELQKNGTTASIHVGDLTKAAAAEKLFSDVVKQHGKVDIMVNTVGMVLKKPIVKISEAEYDVMFAVNSKAAFFLLKEAAKHIEEGGKIVTVVTALLGTLTGFYTSYAGSKAPVEHFTRGVAKELADKKISVNCIAPGPMDTPFFYPQETPEAVAFHKTQGMGGRLTETQDIAPIIKFLCTEGAWITGQTIFANGGYTTR